MSGGLTLTMFREGTHLVPTAEMFVEDLASIPEKREVVVTVRRARSPQHLRTFFGKLRSAIDLGFWDGDTDSLLSYIKIGIGHCTTVIDATSTLVSERMLALAERVLERHGVESEEGRLAKAMIELAGPRSWLIPKSIAMESLSQDEFNSFDERSDRFLAERLGADPGALFRHMVDRAQARKEAQELPGTAIVDLSQDHGTCAAPRQPDEPPLDERLRAIGFELGYAETRDDLEKMWGEAKHRPEVKALHQQAPEILKEIVQAAREKARGEMDEAAFDRTVRALAEKAGDRRAA